MTTARIADCQAAVDAALDALIAKRGLRSLKEYDQLDPLFITWIWAERQLEDAENTPEPTLGDLFKRAYGSDRNVNAIYDGVYGK